MNRIKVEKNRNYTVISNVFLRDEDLSLKAKGLMAVIMSLPENWDFSVKGITQIVKEGRTAIYSAIDELLSIGYCTRVECRNEKGFSGYDYTFYESPIKSKIAQNLHTENLNAQNLHTENLLQISIEKLSTDSINKEINTPSHSENFNFEKKQNDIPLIDKLNEKEKPATISKNEISGNEINYDKFVERVRELVQLDNEEKRRRYITNMGVKPSNEKANEILQEEFKRYAAKRFGDGCNFPLNNNHERLMKWLEDSSRIGFSDFNLWTCSQYAIQNAAAMMKDKPAKVQAQEKKGTGGFSQLIKK